MIPRPPGSHDEQVINTMIQHNTNALGRLGGGLSSRSPGLISHPPTNIKSPPDGLGIPVIQSTIYHIYDISHVLLLHMASDTSVNTSLAATPSPTAIVSTTTGPSSFLYRSRSLAAPPTGSMSRSMISWA